jgi:hypothetical protein
VKQLPRHLFGSAAKGGKTNLANLGQNMKFSAKQLKLSTSKQDQQNPFKLWEDFL